MARKVSSLASTRSQPPDEIVPLRVQEKFDARSLAQFIRCLQVRVSGRTRSLMGADHNGRVPGEESARPLTRRGSRGGEHQRDRACSLTRRGSWGARRSIFGEF